MTSKAPEKPVEVPPEPPEPPPEKKGLASFKKAAMKLQVVSRLQVEEEEDEEAMRREAADELSNLLPAGRFGVAKVC